MNNPAGISRIAGWAFTLCCAAAMAKEAASSPYPAFYPADARRGESLAAACVACHGAGLTFGSPQFHAPKLGGQRPSAIFEALLQYRDGRRRSNIMAPVAGAMVMQDMRDVSAYLAGAQIKPSFAPVPNGWARSRVMDDCAACHGESGLGVMIGYPIIGGQYGDYIVHALRAYRNGERSDPTMVRMAKKLTHEQLSELAAYFEYFSDRNYLRSAP